MNKITNCPCGCKEFKKDIIKFEVYTIENCKPKLQETIDKTQEIYKCRHCGEKHEWGKHEQD